MAAERFGMNGASLIHQVMTCSIFLLCLMVAGGWSFHGWPFAQSILIGGVLVNGSFLLLQRDVLRLMERVGMSEEGVATGVNVEKTRFFLRSVARFIVLGLLLFVLASQVPINAIGLTLGLATIMVSVVIIGMRVGRREMSRKV